MPGYRSRYTGGFFPLSSGAAPAPAGVVYPTTGAELATALGIATAPTHMYRLAGTDATSRTDLVGSATLTAAGADLSEYTHPTLEGTVRFGAGGSAIVYPSSNEFQPGTNSLTVLMLGDFFAAPVSSIRYYYNATGSGQEIQLRSRTADDRLTVIGVGAATITETSATRPVGIGVMILQIHRTDAKIYAVNTTDLNAETDGSGLGSVAPTGIPFLGNTSASMGMDIAMYAVWNGVGNAGGEEIDLAAINALKSSVGI